MPAGVSWGQYLKYTSAAMLSMFAGAQTVHLIYKPMDDIDQYVQDELKRIAAEAKLASGGNENNSST